MRPQARIHYQRLASVTVVSKMAGVAGKIMRVR